jgi:Asp-tRNA(Asn)/Glu-tRNA(Gln) amidotransferase A subunit family amidase
MGAPLPGLAYPMALQVVGPRFGEERLLAFAAQVNVPGRTSPAS